MSERDGLGYRFHVFLAPSVSIKKPIYVANNLWWFFLAIKKFLLLEIYFPSNRSSSAGTKFWLFLKGRKGENGWTWRYFPVHWLDRERSSGRVFYTKTPQPPKGLSKYPGKKGRYGGGFRDVRSETPRNPIGLPHVLLFPLFLKDSTQVSDNFILIELWIFQPLHSKKFLLLHVGLVKNENYPKDVNGKHTWAEVREAIVGAVRALGPATKQRETRSIGATGTNWLVSSRACGLENFGKIRGASVFLPEAVY